MYILQLDYADGSVEYRHIDGFYCLDTIMHDIDTDFNVYADVVSIKAYKALDQDALELERARIR